MVTVRKAAIADTGSIFEVSEWLIVSNPMQSRSDESNGYLQTSSTPFWPMRWRCRTIQPLGRQALFPALHHSVDRSGSVRMRRRRLRPFHESALLLVLLFGLSLIFTFTALASSHRESSRIKTITVVADDNYPPYIFRNETGALQGIIVDEWRLWERKTGIKVVLIGMNWGRALKFMAAGKADVIDTIFYTKERAKKYDFTPPYASIEVPVFFDKRIGAISDINSLHGFAVGVKSGDASIDILKKNGITTLIEYPSYASIVRAAAARRLKVFCIDQPPGLYYLYKMGIEDEFRYSIPLYTGQFHRAVRKGRNNLLKMINQGFSEISPKAYKNIQNKWIKTSFPFNPRYLTYIFSIIAISAVLGGTLLLWNYLLRRKVTQKTAKLNQTLVALQASEKKYRELVENANSIIMRIDTSANITFFNEYARVFFGYGDEILGRSAVGTIVPETESTGRDMRDMIRDILENPERYTDHINENMRRNGERVWIAWNNKPVYDGDGRLVEILCIGNDVTQRRLVEAERERLASAIAQVDDSVVITDREGKITYVNPAFERLTGDSREKVIGQIPRLLRKDEWDPDFYSDLWKALSIGKTWKGRIVNRKSNGDPYTADSTISPIRNAEGNIINYIAVQRDITELLNLETQLLRAQKMEAVGRLAGGVAHDFNNMLHIILGYSELIMADLDPADPIYKRLKAILHTARSSAELTRQLLTFSRKQIIAPHMIHLNDQVKQIEPLLRRTIGEDVALNFRLSPDLWTVDLDPSQVDQVVVNLAVNARDAMPDGGMLTIETENIRLDEAYCQNHIGCNPGEYVMLTVSDNGCGMDEETQASIFEPFFTTKEEGKGTGIGLATVYGIVRQNNGNILVYSEPGHGTTFRIYFLRHRGSAKAHPEDARSTAPVSGNETIVLVEDQTLVREMTQTMLEQLGYNVLSACDPGDAVLLCETHREEIQLLLTDVIMPVMNGKELSQNIRKLRPNIKILYMSGYTASSIAHHGVLEPGVNYIQKPFSLEELSTKVRIALEES